MAFLDPKYKPLALPRRIVSLVPSQTELLCDLGLETETVGITKFCVHPEAWFRSKQRIGGTKSIHFDRVQALQPDLILANKEENTKEQVEALQAIAPVWMSDIHHLDEALQMIRTVGDLTGKEVAAAAIAEKIAAGFRQLPFCNDIPTLYLIWRNPWMSIGKDTFIHDMMRHMGLRNVCEDRERYPQLDEAAIQAAAPRLVLLSSEPYPFKEQHIAALQQLVPGARILLADGEMFSWYGSRLLQAPAYFEKLAGQINAR